LQKVRVILSFFAYFNKFSKEFFLYFPTIMSLYDKTTFGRACVAGSKIVFSDLHFNAPNMPNKPFYFQGSKNGSEGVHRQPWASEACLNANLPPPPPILYSKKNFPFNKEVHYENQPFSIGGYIRISLGIHILRKQSARAANHRNRSSLQHGAKRACHPSTSSVCQQGHKA
jgi:hypothetical protein